MSFRVNEMVPASQLDKAVKTANQWRDTAKNAIDILRNAKGILEAPITKNNLANAIKALELLPCKDYLQHFVPIHIVRSAKTAGAYCRIIIEKCKRTGKYYNGFNPRYGTFNNLPDWFVYEAFKERAIKNPTGAFAGRFRDQLVLFILDQQKYQNKYQERNSPYQDQVRMQ